MTITRNGQGTLEYLFLIGLLAAGLISMAVYMKRGYQGHIKGLGDQVSSQYSPSTAVVNSREVKITSATIVSQSDTTTVYGDSGDTSSTTSLSSEDSDERVTKTISEGMGSYADERWD